MLEAGDRTELGERGINLSGKFCGATQGCTRSHRRYICMQYCEEAAARHVQALDRVDAVLHHIFRWSEGATGAGSGSLCSAGRGSAGRPAVCCGPACWAYPLQPVHRPPRHHARCGTAHTADHGLLVSRSQMLDNILQLIYYLPLKLSATYLNA